MDRYRERHNVTERHANAEIQWQTRWQQDRQEECYIPVYNRKGDDAKSTSGWYLRCIWSISIVFYKQNQPQHFVALFIALRRQTKWGGGRGKFSTAWTGRETGRECDLEKQTYREEDRSEIETIREERNRKIVRQTDRQSERPKKKQTNKEKHMKWAWMNE